MRFALMVEVMPPHMIVIGPIVVYVHVVHVVQVHVVVVRHIGVVVLWHVLAADHNEPFFPRNPVAGRKTLLRIDPCRCQANDRNDYCIFAVKLTKNKKITTENG